MLTEHGHVVFRSLPGRPMAAGAPAAAILAALALPASAGTARPSYDVRQILSGQSPHHCCDAGNAPATCPGPGFPPNYLGQLNMYTGQISHVWTYGAGLEPAGMIFVAS